jgi:hypothetical protein
VRDLTLRCSEFYPTFESLVNLRRLCLVGGHLEVRSGSDDLWDPCSRALDKAERRRCGNKVVFRSCKNFVK